MNGRLPHKCTLADSIETYDVRTWGSPDFGVNEKGNIIVHPDGPQGAGADLKELTSCAAAASVSRSGCDSATSSGGGSWS